MSGRLRSWRASQERNPPSGDRAGTALSVEHLSVQLGGAIILHDVCLDLAKGSSLAIMGPSGSGKSTLLAAILGLARASSGRVAVDDCDVGRMSEKRKRELRRHGIGMVFQQSELMPELEPAENVAIAALIAGMAPKVAWQKAVSLLEEFGVAASGLATAELSGGERQRVAIARALVNEPELVLADEPTGSLDAALGDEVADILFSVPRSWGSAVLLVTHDKRLSARADEVRHLVGGRLLAPATS